MIRIVTIRTANQAGKKRRFRQSQRRHIFVEIRARRFAKTVNRKAGLLPEIDLVAIERENFFFRQTRFQNDRHVRFSDLALQRALWRKQQILHQLLRNARAALVRQWRVWIGVVSPQQRANNSAHVHAVMFKERPVFGGRDCLPEIGGQIVEAHYPAFGAFVAGHGTDQFRLELRFIQARPTVLVRDCRDRFSAGSELNPQRIERPQVVDHRILARIDLDRRTIHAIAPARAFALLAARDVTRALQISDEIVLRKRLAGANLFRRCIDAG